MEQTSNQDTKRGHAARESRKRIAKLRRDARGGICPIHGTPTKKHGRKIVLEVCVECKREVNRRWRHNNPGRSNLLGRLDYQRHPQRHMDASVRAYHKKRTLEAGRPPSIICELCSEVTKTVFDHDHASMKFRGWLCKRCNVTLGYVRDNPELLAKMILYLKRHSIEATNDSSKEDGQEFGKKGPANVR